MDVTTWHLPSFYRLRDGQMDSPDSREKNTKATLPRGTY